MAEQRTRTSRVFRLKCRNSFPSRSSITTPQILPSFCLLAVVCLGPALPVFHVVLVLVVAEVEGILPQLEVPSVEEIRVLFDHDSLVRVRVLDDVQQAWPSNHIDRIPDENRTPDHARRRRLTDVPITSRRH